MFKEGFKWILCIYIAFVFVQSLFFKFTDAYETVYIFSVLGNWSGLDWFAEYGAYGVGITELIAAILLMIPACRLYGAILSAGVMAGAVFFHLFTPLGINMPEFDNTGNIIGDDGGLLFYNASGMLVAAVVVAIMEFFDTDNAIKRILF
ncbi:MauE/DoxX family redox-associated membrane protein [Endozoicomonas numazuensis]|uniref:Methylamine utilization protein MauE n=1 Tax=Endozoicomonas numazuensis TaxID=1137799 RepID=A0A081NIA9_9GAMM|nr:MauE/DoxX family redox-associated membrane protein [Endozoicomonas numazuensis]KEQ18182.1 membrane protein [Endozoicomonas numazuensis]